MKRTTVKLPEELDDRLRHEAQLRGVTVSELTREALAQFLSAPTGRRNFGGAAAGRSGRTDTSSRIDEILEKEWGR